MLGGNRRLGRRRVFGVPVFFDYVQKRRMWRSALHLTVATPSMPAAYKAGEDSFSNVAPFINGYGGRRV